MSIAEQAKQIATALNDWAHADGGKAFIASDVAHMWAQAWSRTDTPKAIIVYMGEDMRGAFSIAAATFRVDRQFGVLVTRGRGFNAERGESLTDTRGNARPLFDLVEEARDIIRTLYGVSAEFPVDFKNIHTIQMGERVMDAYMIEFSVAVDLPAISSTPDNPAPIIGT